MSLLKIVDVYQKVDGSTKIVDRYKIKLKKDRINPVIGWN